MKIKIRSAMAERAGREVTEWTGWVPGLTATMPVEKMLEIIFRLFNRVDEADGLRLEQWGYLLPSLSVDDTVTVAGRTFLCAPVGWQEMEQRYWVITAGGQLEEGLTCEDYNRLCDSGVTVDGGPMARPEVV